MAAPFATAWLILSRGIWPHRENGGTDPAQAGHRRRQAAPLERRFYNRVNLILATSPNYAAGSTFLAQYQDRLKVLPMGIDLESYLHPSQEQRRAENGDDRR